MIFIISHVKRLKKIGAKMLYIKLTGIHHPQQERTMSSGVCVPGASARVIGNAYCLRA